MPVYVALLRGINIGPHKRLKMDRLRESFEALGFERVDTYIQSGNVVFKAGKFSAGALCRKIEKRLLADFGFPIVTILRTRDELAAAIKNNPFLKERAIDLTKLHVTFLSNAPVNSGLEQLDTMLPVPDRSRCLGQEIYWHLPNGVGQSILMKVSVDRILGASITTRNWRTVNAILQMCENCG